MTPPVLTLDVARPARHVHVTPERPPDDLRVDAAAGLAGPLLERAAIDPIPQRAADGAGDGLAGAAHFEARLTSTVTVQPARMTFTISPRSQSHASRERVLLDVSWCVTMHI